MSCKSSDAEYTVNILNTYLALINMPVKHSKWQKQCNTFCLGTYFSLTDLNTLPYFSHLSKWSTHALDFSKNFQEFPRITENYDLSL